MRARSSTGVGYHTCTGRVGGGERSRAEPILYGFWHLGPHTQPTTSNKSTQRTPAPPSTVQGDPCTNGRRMRPTPPGRSNFFVFLQPAAAAAAAPGYSLRALAGSERPSITGRVLIKTMKTPVENMTKLASTRFPGCTWRKGVVRLALPAGRQGAHHEPIDPSRPTARRVNCGRVQRAHRLGSWLCSLPPGSDAG